MKALLITAAATAALLAGQANAKTITVTPGGDVQEKLQTALIDAKPGDTVMIAAGRYEPYRWPVAGRAQRDGEGRGARGDLHLA